MKGFELSEAEAMQILESDWNSRLDRKWTEAELTHKVKSAVAMGKPPVGEEVGWLKKSGGGGFGETTERGPSVTAAPGVETGKKMTFDTAALRRVFRAEAAKESWFMERSPIPVENLSPLDYLKMIYRPDDRVLIFTEFKSQGNFMAWRGETFRLGQRPDVKAVRSDLPRGTDEGMWYLNQPVSGAWALNSDNRLSRRSAATVTRFPYMVIENDPPAGSNVREIRELWLSFVAQMHLPIVAVYDSGGKSIHVLVKLEDSKTKEEFNRYRRLLGPFLSRYGADHAAITPVRLTRLPGAFRGKRQQRLLYLNPTADVGGLAIIEGGNI